MSSPRRVVGLVSLLVLGAHTLARIHDPGLPGSPVHIVRPSHHK